MALINCGNCGGQISDKAKICPHCGAALNSNPVTVQRKKERNRNDIQITKKEISVFIGGILLICIVLAGIMLGKYIKKDLDYKNAIKLLDEKKYDDAATIFIKLGNFKNANEMENECNYRKAMEFYEAGEYEEAAHIFSNIKGYRDSEKYLQDYKLCFLINDIGNVVHFGEYDWYIIEKNNRQAMLLSVGKVCDRAYHDTWEEAEWAECTIRGWLNNDFYNKFNEEEKEMIILSTCPRDKNETSGLSCSKTEDYIFLLSMTEAERLDKRMRNIGEKWWLRTPGAYYSLLAQVDWEGDIFWFGDGGGNEPVKAAVRPALRIKF